MTIELAIFGAALTIVAVANKVYLSDQTNPPTGKHFAAGTEYALGSILLFFATPLTHTPVGIGAFGVIALAGYGVVSYFAPQLNATLPDFRVSSNGFR